MKDFLSAIIKLHPLYQLLNIKRAFGYLKQYEELHDPKRTNEVAESVMFQGKGNEDPQIIYKRKLEEITKKLDSIDTKQAVYLGEFISTIALYSLILSFFSFILSFFSLVF